MLRHRATILPSGTRIRVLVVDDSASMRSIVTRTLSEEGSIEVVGTAANGAIGMSKIAQVNPNVVTLDIEMPEMNGLEMLKRLRQQYPDIVVIMISTLTAPGATATLDALMLGANDYVTKPSACGSLAEAIAVLRAELVPKIKQFFTFADRAADKAATTAISTATVRSPTRQREILGIGVSTGGPNALSAIMPMFPVPFPTRS